LFFHHEGIIFLARLASFKIERSQDPSVEKTTTTMEQTQVEPTVVVDVVANEIVEEDSSSSAAPDPQEAESSYSASDEVEPPGTVPVVLDLEKEAPSTTAPVEQKRFDDAPPGSFAICPVEPAHPAPEGSEKEVDVAVEEAKPAVEAEELPQTQPLEEQSPSEEKEESKKRDSSGESSQSPKRAKSASQEEQ
jgi:hypothetical protein